MQKVAQKIKENGKFLEKISHVYESKQGYYIEEVSLNDPFGENYSWIGPFTLLEVANRSPIIDFDENLKTTDSFEEKLQGKVLAIENGG